MRKRGRERNRERGKSSHTTQLGDGKYNLVRRKRNGRRYAEEEGSKEIKTKQELTHRRKTRRRKRRKRRK